MGCVKGAGGGEVGLLWVEELGRTNLGEVGWQVEGSRTTYRVSKPLTIE